MSYVNVRQIALITQLVFFCNFNSIPVMYVLLILLHFYRYFICKQNVTFNE